MSTATIPYRADVDGLRAVAVLSVLLFHAGLGCPGGFVGVDIFFVISGFLITSLVVKELDHSKFQLVEFWERRVRRIVPALSVSIAFTILLGWCCYLPSDFAQLGKATIAQGAVISNMFHWRSIGYFTPSTDAFPLLHTWSLAVEEQFYIVLPLLLLFIRRWCWKWLPLLLAVGFSVSLALSVWLVQTRPDAAFYLLPSRAWELLIGAMLAACPTWGHSISPRMKAGVAALGMVTLLGTIALYSEELPFPGLLALLPTLGTAAVIWANRDGQTVIGRWLSWSPMLFVGKISYSLYLIHWPLFAVANYWFRDEITWTARSALTCASFVLAVLSWRFVETPFRKREVLSQRPALFTWAAITTVLLMGCGFIIARGGISQHFDPRVLAWLPPTSDRTYSDAQLSFQDAIAGKLFEFGPAESQTSILVWGDSHAMSLMPVFEQYCRSHQIRGYAGMYSNTPPLLDFVASERFGLKAKTPEFSSAVLKSAIHKRVQTVILIGAWNQYAEHPGFEAAVRKTIQQLSDAGISVVLVLDVPHHQGDVPRLLARAAILGRDPAKVGVPVSEHDKLNEAANRVLRSQATAHVLIVDPSPALIDDTGLCRAEFEGVTLYRDPGHLTNRGAMRLYPEMSRVLNLSLMLNSR